MSIDDKRLRFEKAEVRSDEHGMCRVEVTFTFGSRVIRGAASDLMEGKGPVRAAAVATLNGVEQAVGGKFRCTLHDVDHVSALGKDLIAVLVNIEFEGKPFQLFGSCQLSGSEVDVAVKAALNATNRFVELALDS